MTNHPSHPDRPDQRATPATHADVCPPLGRTSTPITIVRAYQVDPERCVAALLALLTRKPNDAAGTQDIPAAKGVRDADAQPPP